MYVIKVLFTTKFKIIDSNLLFVFNYNHLPKAYNLLQVPYKQ